MHHYISRLIASVFLFQISIANSFAQQCDPVVSGAIFNVAAECLNESAALVADPGSADEHGWQYSDDTNQDSVNGGTVGGTVFEIYGTAFSERYFPNAVGDLNKYQLCFVINSNLPLTGTHFGAAQDDNVGWGDLLVNFGTDTFLVTSDDSGLFGLRFAGSNDSAAASIGTYVDVMAKSVTGVNSGFASWNAYANYVNNKGKTPTMGDLGSDPTYYYAGTISQNVIKTGTLATTDITFLTKEELDELGFDTDRWEGAHNIGFCWRKSDWIDPCGVIGGDGSSCTHCDVLCGPGGEDADKDGFKACEDDCESDPEKTAAGQCGCGVADTDSDKDGTANCNDDCVDDPNKTAAGQCGCGVADTDSDKDGTANCNDDCIDDPNKIEVGQCGCGVADTDSDKDGTANCNDECIDDPEKTAAGVCGCGVADVNSDQDEVLDCNDGCPTDSDKTEPGACGCGVADTDSDGDGTPDCNDLCPADVEKTAPGECGCGFSEHFCGPITTASCGDGLLHQSEQCDDGNDEVGDGCVNCQLEDDVIEKAECEIERTTEQQRRLDGLAKKLERKGKLHAQLLRRLLNSKGQKLGRWIKQLFKRLNENQVAAWVAIWLPGDEHITCNDEGKFYCEEVSNVYAFDLYLSHMDMLFKDSRIVRKRLKKAAKLYGDQRLIRKARKYKRYLRKRKIEMKEGLAKLPQTTLRCSEVVKK